MPLVHEMLCLTKGETKRKKTKKAIPEYKPGILIQMPTILEINHAKKGKLMDRNRNDILTFGLPRPDS